MLIESGAISFKHPLKSQWLVETNNTIQWWFDRLNPVMDSDDKLFISQVLRDKYNGWLAQEVWDWLRARV